MTDFLSSSSAAIDGGLPLSAHSVAVFRACQHDAGIGYSATIEAKGRAAVAALLTGLARDGLVDVHCRRDDFAVLDIVDNQGTPLADRGIRTSTAFERIRDALRLRVTCSDCDECDPHRRMADR
ncbi:MAG: hypothetical protein PHQ28_00885 [Mycobacterium sp.]|nr:hypothetical protein [Mycobacterium sp.]